LLKAKESLVHVVRGLFLTRMTWNLDELNSSIDCLHFALI